MASDADPRLKPRRKGSLSQAQKTALVGLGVVLLVAMGAYYSEVLWEIEHVRKAHAYVSDKAAGLNRVAYDVGEKVQSAGAVKTLNQAAYKIGQAVTPTAQTFASGFQAMGQAWFGTYDYYYDYSTYDDYSQDSTVYYDDYYGYTQQWWDDELEEDFANEWQWDEDFWQDYAQSYFGDDQDYFWQEASELGLSDFEFDYIMPYDDWNYLDYFDSQSGLAPGVVPSSLKKQAAPYNEFMFDDDEFETVLDGDEFWPDFNDPDELDDFFDWSRDWQLGKEQSNFDELARLDNDVYFQLNDDGYDYELLFWGDDGVAAGGKGETNSRRSVIEDIDGVVTREAQQRGHAKRRALNRLSAARKAADRVAIAELIAFEEGYDDLDAAHAEAKGSGRRMQTQQPRSTQQNRLAGGDRDGGGDGHVHKRTHARAEGKPVRGAARRVLQ